MAVTVCRRMARALPPAIIAILLFAALAQAHSYIESSVPRDGATLDVPPAEVRLTYTEPLEPRVTTLTLVDAQGRTVPGIRQTVEGNRTLILKLPPLSGGKYTVKTKTLGRDGHVTEETLQFTVNAPRDNAGNALENAPAPALVKRPDRDAPPPAASRQRYFRPIALWGSILAALVVIGSVLYGVLTRPRKQG